MTGYYTCCQKDGHEEEGTALLVGPFLEKQEATDFLERTNFALAHGDPIHAFFGYWKTGVATVEAEKFPIGQFTWMWDWLVIDPSFVLETKEETDARRVAESTDSQRVDDEVRA